MEIPPSPCPQPADVAAPAPPPGTLPAAVAPRVHAGRSFSPCLRHHEISKPDLSNRAALREPCVARHPVWDLAETDARPAASNPLLLPSRFEQFPIRASAQHAWSLHRAAP